jgi:hypothetical protein
MSNEKRWVFLAQWSALNLLGWGIGLLGAYQVSRFLFGPTDNLYLIAMFRGLFFGVSIGLFQWVMLRKFGLNLFKWTFVTSLGWGAWAILSEWFLVKSEFWDLEIHNFFQWSAFGFSFLFLGQSTEVGKLALSVVLLIGDAIIGGALLGMLQLVLLRKHISKPGQWIGANIFGLLLLTAAFGSWVSRPIFFLFPREVSFSCDYSNIWFPIIIAAFLGVAILTGKVLWAHSTLNLAAGAEPGASKAGVAWTMPGKSQRRFLAEWCGLNFLALGIGYLVVTVGFLWFIPGFINQPVGMMLFGGCVGAIVGILQWDTLRNSDLKLLEWTFVTALGGSAWAMFSGWFDGCWSFGYYDEKVTVIQFMVAAAIGVTLLGILQSVILGKYTSRSALWIWAHIFGLLLPIVVGVIIVIFHSFLKRALFPFGLFLFFYVFSDLRWKCTIFFLFIIICLGISILTGKILWAQSKTDSAAGAAPAIPAHAAGEGYDGAANRVNGCGDRSVGL